MPPESLDRLLVQLPGLQAEFAAQALNLEGLTCALECQGIRQVRPPGREPGEPFAVTLPVSIYVAGSELQAARDVLRSFAGDDLIGEQWSGDDDTPPISPRSVAGDAAPVPPPEAAESVPPPRLPTAMEGTTLRFLLFLFAAVAAWFLLSRSLDPSHP
jgi:hypothetical protein